ncbi:MAG: branched-chain amino acid ABC transporter permease [Phycisphaerales bacterium]|nr:branched-chain amino acid ABC transporter permease [Planctomycetota bacterium]
MASLQDRAKLFPSSPVGAAWRLCWPILVALGLGVLMQLVVRPSIDAYSSTQILNIGIAIILAVSLTIVNGFTGQFSIGHAGFLAVGGYVAGSIAYYGSFALFGSGGAKLGLLSGLYGAPAGAPLLSTGDLLFFGSLLAGGLIAALLGVAVGLPSLRLKGDYLAIVTLGFGEIVRVLIQQTPQVLMSKEAIEESPAWKVPFSVGGSLGFGNVPKYTSHFWVYGAVVLTLIFAYRLKQSSTGRALLSIREDEIAAEAMGVRTTYYKVWGFVFAAFFAGIAGGLYAHTLGIALSPNDAGFQKSFDIIIMVVLGGLGSISGAAIAAAIVTYLPELLRTPATLEKFAIAGVPLLVVGLALYAMAGPARSDAEKKSGRDRRALPRFLIGLSVIIIGLSVLAFAARRFSINLGEYRLIIYALALIVMMITRPQGLLGVRELWDGALYRPIRDFFAPRVGLKGGA